MTLRELRESLGMTQQQVADGMGMTQAWVSKIEMRRLSQIQVNTLNKYITALGGTLSLQVVFGPESKKKVFFLT